MTPLGKLTAALLAAGASVAVALLAWTALLLLASCSRISAETDGHDWAVKVHGSVGADGGLRDRRGD